MFWLSVIYYNASLLGLGFWYLRVLVTRSFILILIFQREVLYKYYYCHVFVIFEKLKKKKIRTDFIETRVLHAFWLKGGGGGGGGAF